METFAQKKFSFRPVGFSTGPLFSPSRRRLGVFRPFSRPRISLKIIYTIYTGPSFHTIFSFFVLDLSVRLLLLLYSSIFHLSANMVNRSTVSKVGESSHSMQFALCTLYRCSIQMHDIMLSLNQPFVDVCR